MTDISKLRSAVLELGVKGTEAVDAVRKAFVSGAPPLQTAGSGSAADYVSRFGGKGLTGQVIDTTSRLGLNTSVVGSQALPQKPELDFIQLESDRNVGVLDGFYAKIVASLPVNAQDIRFIRVMRSTGTALNGVGKPAVSALIDQPTAVRSKSQNQSFSAATRVNAIGVGNKMTDFVSVDSFSNRLTVIGSSSLRMPPPLTNTNMGSTTTGLLTIAGADRTVLQNTTFYLNRRAVTPNSPVELPLSIGRVQGINVLSGGSISTGGSTVVQGGNAAGFHEIARVSVAGSPRVGDFMEVEYDDGAVVYGMSYTYYVTAISNDGRESARSRLVVLNVVRNQPPAAPSVTYNVVAGLPRFSLRCSGSFVDHVEIFRRGGTEPPTSILLSTDSAMIAEGVPTVIDSGFYHLRDVGTGVDKSGIFVDRDVTAGQTLDYRIYTVDSFGMKSQTPFSCSVVLPDHGARIPLPVPSITAEQAPGGRVVNVSVSCNDPRITTFVIGRREIHLRESAFRQPTQPDKFTLGRTSPKRSRSRIGPCLNISSQKAWSGIIEAVSGSGKLVDQSVEFDRVYQYAVSAVDIRGNATPSVPSAHVQIAVKPISEVPVAVSATVLLSDKDIPTGVQISWALGTLDFSPQDLIGDQDVLQATLQRTVFQVERRGVGKSNWDTMPSVTGGYFIDPVGSDQAPKFRPAYALANSEYDYRVISMQSGGLLSTYSDPIRVSVIPAVIAPSVVWVKSSSTAVRPTQIVLSWNYDGAFVDSWEISRAVVNKIFSSKISSMSSKVARDLEYTTIAKVTRESSQSRGISVRTVTVDPALHPGNRFYVDHNVDLVNSYFYRVRAIDSIGRHSDWTYAGISLTDSPFDRKFLSSLSDVQKEALVMDPRAGVTRKLKR